MIANQAANQWLGAFDLKNYTWPKNLPAKERVISIAKQALIFLTALLPIVGLAAAAALPLYYTMKVIPLAQAVAIIGYGFYKLAEIADESFFKGKRTLPKIVGIGTLALSTYLGLMHSWVSLPLIWGVAAVEVWYKNSLIQ